jgi:hypothetical protein
MARNVLLLGLTRDVIDEVLAQLHMPDVRFLGGTGIDDVRSAFVQSRIDHVIMGAGLDLETRLEIVREVFRASDTTTVHMKDRSSGSYGLLPFVRSLLRGLADFEADSPGSGP